MDDLNGNHSKMFLNANVTISSEKDQDEEALVDSTLVPLVGKRLIYMYENGWEYEVYYKNKSNIDYKVLKRYGGGAMCQQPNHTYATIISNVRNVYG